MSRSRRERVGEAGLEVDASGTGEPVVVIQTALDADELRPLMQHLTESGRLRCWHYHRRGYAGSGPVGGDGSIARDADDCADLIRALGLATAHVLGASYSAAVALTLASASPQHVRTLTVIEPPPGHSPEFRAANARLLETYHRRGASLALDDFMTMLAGPSWRAQSDGSRAGSVSGLERDAATFFGHDVPALLSWEFGAAQAATITCPVLYVGGADTMPMFARMRQDTLAVLPHAECELIPGAGHLVAATHPAQTAHRVVEFVGRHGDVR